MGILPQDPQAKDGLLDPFRACQTSMSMCSCVTATISRGTNLREGT